MALRYGGRKLSFDVLNGDYDYDYHYDNKEDEETQTHNHLYRSVSDSFHDVSSNKSNKQRKRKSKKKKQQIIVNNLLIEEEEEEPIKEKRVDAVFDHLSSYSVQTVVCEEIRVSPDKENGSSIRTVHQILNGGGDRQHHNHHPFVEVRRRSRPPSDTFDESMVMSLAKEESRSELGSAAGQLRLEPNGGGSFGTKLGSAGPLRSEPNGGGSFGTKLESKESLDWKQFMAEDSDFSSMEKSPVKYFMGEIYSGNSLRGTTTLGNEKERERVYDTIFRLPWRCELIIDVGFFVCLDSFLSLLTIMPTRILMTFWRFIYTRQFRRPSAAELSDFSCFIVLACGVTLLQQADISLIYHMIRGQGTIKLYVVYNVLEIFDKLCQNFCGDVLQTMFSSAKGLSSSPPENLNFWLWRFVSDQALTVVASIAHSFILLAQAITLSTCIVSHNNALMALLVSNNFAEIKSNVFKRFSKDNIHNLVYFDSIERFHISAFILFVLAQNILEAEGPWFGSFLSNALLVYICEMIIDIIKHSFIAKFNEIKPIAYSEFLEELCKQTLNIQPEDVKNNLTFVPLAPACVVIRVLTPVYAAHLPYGPLPWRLLWIVLLSAMTYVMLASLKVMVGMGLRKHATWYVNRCQRRKLHSD